MRFDKSLLPDWVRTEPPFHMYDAILATPSIVKECLEGEVAERAKLAGQEIAKRGIKRAYCIGCGTSRFAAIHAAFALTEIAGIDADYCDAFTFLNYKIHLAKEDTAILAFSHSGTTTVTYLAVEAARKAGALTIGFTDIVDSRTADSSEFVVDGGAGNEIPMPKTRSYINTLAMAYQVAAAVVGDDSVLEELRKVPAYLEKVRENLEDKIKGLAEEYKGYKRVFFAGGGVNMTTAFEGALKLKETVWYHAEGMEIEESLHGPTGALDEDTLVITVSTEGPAYEKADHFLRTAAALGCKVLSVTDKPHGIENVVTLEVPTEGLRELLTGLVLIYPIYFYNHYLALALGIIPDGIRLGDPVWAAAGKAAPSTHDPGK